MLVLSRKFNESVAVGGINCTKPMLKVTVLEISGSRVMLGFDADAGVPVHRWEVWERIVTSMPAGHGPGGKSQRPDRGCSARTSATAR